MDMIKQFFSTAFRYKYWILLSGLILIGCIGLVNYRIGKFTEGKLYSDVRSVPKNKVGLVLGTARYLSNGQENQYFTYRVNAAVALYRAGKIDYILVSGDNSRKEYDEPSDFKRALVKKGIPGRKIYLDYAGFRTLDSIVRAQKIFSLDQFTVISQPFHNERAVYIAHQKGIRAVGFNAKDIPLRYAVKVKIREYLARVKVHIDLFLQLEPKFLGEKVVIP